jgi:hypothetical protein
MNKRNKRTKCSTFVLVCAVIAASSQGSITLASPIAFGLKGIAPDGPNQAFGRMTNIDQINGRDNVGTIPYGGLDTPNLASFFSVQIQRNHKGLPFSRSRTRISNPIYSPAKQFRAKALSRQELDLLKNVNQMAQSKMDPQLVWTQISSIRSLSANSMQRIYNAPWSLLTSAIKRKTLRLASSKTTRPDVKLLTMVSRQKHVVAQRMRQNKVSQSEDFEVLEEMEQTFLRNMEIQGFFTPKEYKETLPQTLGAFRILESRKKPESYILQILQNTPFQNQLEPVIFRTLLNKYGTKNPQFWVELRRIAPREKWYIDALKQVAGAHFKSGNRLLAQENKKTL